jgi:hypothetical protein
VKIKNLQSVRNWRVLRWFLVLAAFTIGNGLSISPVQAEEPAWWTQQKRDCGLPPSTTYNTWIAQGMPCGRGPDSGPDLFQLSVARYEATLVRLRAYPRIHVNFNAPSPRTPEELSRQADARFVESAFWLDRLAFDSKELVKDMKAQDTYLQGLYAQERDLKERVGALPAALREANKNLVRALAMAEARERAVASVEAVADRMHTRAERAATESVQWLTVASPPGSLLVSAQTVADRQRAAREPLSVPIEPIDLNAGRSAVPVALHPKLLPGPRTAPPGTADDKIAAIETLLPQIATITAQYEERASNFLKVKRLVDNVTPRVEALEAAVGGGERSLGAVEALHRKAQSRIDQASINSYRAGANAAGAIAEAYILETFRDKVIIPEVKRFLRANGITRKIDRSQVAQLYVLGKSVLPRGGTNWKALNQLVQAEKRALAVIDDFKIYAQAAAAASALPTDKRGLALAEEIRAGTEASGEEIIVKASGGTGPTYTIARAIMGRRS